MKTKQNPIINCVSNNALNNNDEVDKGVVKLSYYAFIDIFKHEIIYTMQKHKIKGTRFRFWSKKKCDRYIEKQKYSKMNSGYILNIIEYIIIKGVYIKVQKYPYMIVSLELKVTDIDLHFQGNTNYIWLHKDLLTILSADYDHDLLNVSAI